MAKRVADQRPEVLEGAPMRFAPQSELGVVFLFSRLAKKYGLRVDTVQGGFPDCVAYQKTQGKENKIRIEFEFKAKNLKIHRHDQKGCDWIVCWENNWPDAPKRLNIVELRREYGLGFNVWILPAAEKYRDKLNNYRSANWSLPSQCHEGDLLLFYFTKTQMAIGHVFVATERAKLVKAIYKGGKKDYMGDIERICIIKSPVFLDDLRAHRVLKTAGFVRARMIGRPNVTEYWPYLHDMIIKRNRPAKKLLSRFAPENI